MNVMLNEIVVCDKCLREEMWCYNILVSTSKVILIFSSHVNRFEDHGRWKPNVNLPICRTAMNLVYSNIFILTMHRCYVGIMYVVTVHYFV